MTISISRHTIIYPVKKVISRLLGMALLCGILQTDLHAQAGTSVVLTVSKPEITATNEELVDMVVKLQNRTSAPLAATVHISAATNLELVSRAETAFELPAGDSLFIPVKIFVNKKAQSGRVHLINIQLLDKNQTVMAEARSQLRVSVKRNVQLYTLVSNILLDNSIDSVIIPVRISNAGNTIQKVTLISSFPAQVQEQAFHPTKQFQLRPSTDTLINFSTRVNRKMVNSEGFNVTITGLYENSDVMGMGYVRVQSARSNRNYRDVAGYDNYNENAITLSSQGMFTPMQAYMFRGGGGIDLGTGKIGYNVDLTTWKSGYSPPMLRNTWVDYQTVKGGIRAGSINRNLDLYLAGRGAVAYLNDTASGNRYEAGYIDGNTNLLGNKFSSFFQTGQAGWGVFTHSGKNWQLSSFAVYENNPAMNSRNRILGNNFNLRTPKNIHYTFSVSAAHTAEFISSGANKFGMALSAGVTGSIKEISFHSANYFSTGYYPGIQKGAISLSERITWARTTASSLWANLDYYNYQPKTLSAAQIFLPAFGMLRAETGISGKIGKTSMSAAPRYTRETSNAYQFSGMANRTHSLDAWDITATFNYPVAENQYLAINTEGGVYSSSFDPEQRFHLRSNVFYKRGIFALNATVQLGTFFMGEAANNYVSNINSTYILNIIPSVQKSFFRNKLRTELSIANMSTGYSGNSWYLAGRMEYDMTSKTSFYSSLNYNRYGSYGSSIVEMGITKKLQIPKGGNKSNSLELFVYKDVNENRVYDAADSVAGGYMLYINNDIFMSGANGSIVYKNLPVDKYRLSMPISNGWYAPEQYFKLEQKTRIEIPLQRTGTLRGSISYISNEFSYEINNTLSGIMVTATDNNNHVYRTKTGPEGRYVFYIPVGDYSVGLDGTGLLAEVEVVNNNQREKIESRQAKVINFEIKVKSRKIETKKFVSPSLPKQK